MLIAEDGNMVGAVSGGCVENEVKRRAESVFEDGIAKVITYDGRYRLGCEGILYILIEPFHISDDFLDQFQSVLTKREPITITSYFEKKDDAKGNFGSIVDLKNDVVYYLNNNLSTIDLIINETFRQILQPRLKLLIIGGEHDAVKLCLMASLLGWEVDVLTSIKDPKQISDFPGASSVMAQTPEMVDLKIDSETAVVLMTHNYVQDLKYLLKLVPHDPKYIGILGSTKRREQLLDELFNFKPDLTEPFLESIYSPAGLNIGAITPEEIALSILSEILSVLRNTKPASMSMIKGKIRN